MSSDRVPESICVVLLTGLGDVVHGLPVVNALKAARPDCRITWIVEPMPAPLLSPHPSVDDVVVYRKSRGVRGVLDLRGDLSKRRFDVTLNLNYFVKSVWPTLLSGSPRRVGFERGRSKEGVWLAVNEHLAPGLRRHTQDMFLEFLDHLGLTDYAIEWRIEFSAQERQARDEFLAPLQGKPLVGVVPASANPRKDWIAERYAKVVDALERDLGYRVILLGGPGDRETRMARDIVRLASSEPVWALGDGIRRLAGLISGCDLLIAPDTGPVHLSRALEVPVVGLYGHTNPWRVGPYRKYQDLWIDTYTEAGEAPEPSSTVPKHGRMERITVTDVLERVERARRYAKTAPDPGLFA